MGIVTGYICLVLLLLLLAKYITKRCKLTRANALLMKYHKYIACGFLVISIIHFFLVLCVFDTRAIIITTSGIAITVVGIMLVIVCHTMKDRKKEIKFHRLFSLSLLVLTLIHVIFYFVDLSDYQTAINSITISEIDLSKVENGEYTGEYDAGFIYAKVKVTVNNHMITDVELIEHNHERGAKAEAIVENIVNEQKIDVDTISSATNSSKVIKKACMNALAK